MAEKNINARIIHKHDTEANWNLATNFTPKQGEIIVYDVDATHAYERFKIGDGVTNVTSLPFVTSIGVSGASVGQVIKVKEVDDLGRPIVWEAVTDSTPFIVEFSGNGSTEWPYTSSHTFEQITAAISAGRYVVGHAEELIVSGDSAGGRYNIYFNLVSTMDVAIFQFVDALGRYQIDVMVPAGGALPVDVYGGYLSASTDTYGGVKADSAEETDTQPVRIGTDGKLYTAQVQPDWTQNDASKPDYIKNKPVLGTLASKSTVKKSDLSTDVQESLNKADTELAKKVDKVDGKGLSTNDYTTEEKNKLENITEYTESEIQAIWDEVMT